MKETAIVKKCKDFSVYKSTITLIIFTTLLILTVFSPELRAQDEQAAEKKTDNRLKQSSKLPEDNERTETGYKDWEKHDRKDTYP